MSWAPFFYRQSDLFWPIAPVAARLGACPQWPSVATLNEALSPTPFTFEIAPKRSRRNREPPQPTDRYDARIALASAIPTRERSWHDLLNALVWVTFPRAKRALHLRQHRIIEAQLGHDKRVPSARTKEQDTIAMLDEGGVAVVCRERVPKAVLDSALSGDGALFAKLLDEGGVRQVVFGHAIYESCIAQPSGTVRAQAFALAHDGPLDADDSVLEHVDDALARLLERGEPIVRSDFGTAIVRW